MRSFKRKLILVATVTPAPNFPDNLTVENRRCGRQVIYAVCL
jgi:hypothetical protein